MLQFEDKLAVVTGAAHGIGLAIAKALVVKRTRVVAVDINEKDLDKEFEGSEKVIKIVANVGEESPKDLVQQILKEGVPDFVVNNVGVVAGKPYLTLNESDFDKTYSTNIKGPWFVTKYLVEEAIKQKKPLNIIFILSLHTNHVRLAPDYSTTKAALEMLVKELAVELAPYNIRINGISPGAVDTWSDKKPDSAEKMSRDNRVIPMGRLGEPNEVAPMALALLNDDISGYITGSVVKIDGGLSLHNWLMDVYENPKDEWSK